LLMNCGIRCIPCPAEAGGGGAGSGGTAAGGLILMRFPDEVISVWGEAGTVAGEPLGFAGGVKGGGATVSFALDELGVVAALPLLGALRASRASSSSRSFISSNWRFRACGPI
jgi:hypothetical protein